MSQVTLKSIADELGVSRTTVSNAYNRPDQLTPELRERILATAERLGYRGPDAAARTLRTGRRNAVGLLFTEDLAYVFHDPDTTAFLRGVAETTANAGTGLLLLPVPRGLDPEDSAVPAAVVDGLLIFSVSSEHPVLDLVLPGSGPVVVVDEPDRPDLAGFVGIDDRAGADLAARHLIDLGHRRIGIVMGRLGVEPRSGPVDQSRRNTAAVRVARARLHGYLQTLSDAGVDPDSVPIWETPGNEPDGARIAAAELLRSHPDITALLCFADRLAIGAIQAAQSLGLSVPDDLSVVGFDDIPRATTWEPQLTTIRQPMVDKGRLAARLLLDAIERDTEVTEAARVDLPIELIVRQSTAARRRA